jgi:UDP-N-acetylglucosamine 2-epimerase (non-hydrolysing)/GDP/UDP-N,N'-diacetylbacillosamine 2-epimerase (hydrolysing)
MSKKICVVTGSRAEYGLLYWLIRELSEDAEVELQLVATGMHLMPEFGSTYRAIEADGFKIDRKVEMMLSSDSPVGMAKSVGLGVLGFADALESLSPDVVVVLGDRFEILAVAQAAFISGYPVAHLSGGEVTEGAIDDAIRHAITKLARYHFVAAEAYRNRVIQLGEQPERVFNVGDPGLDNIRRLELLDRNSLCEQLGLATSKPFFLVTYHPVTLGAAPVEKGMHALFEALDDYPDHQVLITKPNADAGGRQLSLMVDAYAQAQGGRVTASTSLGQLRYLSAMKHCAAVVGNSSSGIVEAPAMLRPTVNIGPRQDGRLKASSIIDCAADAAAIRSALDRALSAPFQQQLPNTASLYGDCEASTRVRQILKQVQLGRHIPKSFHDLPS